ncbi:MAG: glycyl-radical enzyme activating protein [Hespellia sp.]|nr:glycyl-radical enzyme activating protein [Hespellia sp.]
MKETCLITDIQRYCIHDGDGIRTTIFFKGCPLHCQWCHNPESQCFLPQLLDNQGKCTGCEACEITCPSRAISLRDKKAYTNRDMCSGCGSCEEFCFQSLREISGRAYTVKQLFDEACKDEMFYQESGGGVTLSGGEVMAADIEFVLKLLKKLNRFGIDCMIDTCGLTAWDNFERILPFVHTFLYDIKVMDEQLHVKYTGVSNEKILTNLEKLSMAGARIYIRIPVVKEVNGSDDAMQDIISFIRERRIQAEKICLLPYHNTGSAKYARLGIAYQGELFHKPDTEELEHWKALFQQAGYPQVQIGG